MNVPKRSVSINVNIFVNKRFCAFILFQIDGTGQITIKPDLNTSKSPYRIQTSGDLKGGGTLIVNCVNCVYH